MPQKALPHIFEAQQFTPEIVAELFGLADELDERPDKSLEGKIMASLFYEPSTRTRLSFESAMLRLGGEVIGTENALSFSSAAKGESLEDSIRVIGAYADVIVLRYFEQNIAKRLAHLSPVPIINAGDGAGQHPTQALLDLYTVYRECGRTDDLHVTAVGDLKQSRTIRSFVYLLSKYANIRFTFVSPPELRMGEDIREYLERHNVQFVESAELTAEVGTTDVLYQTRMQKERFAEVSEYERLRGRYVIDRALVDGMKDGAIVMHPLPRNEEIAPEVDDSPHAVYFKQPHYGLCVRMALLKYLLT